MTITTAIQARWAHRVDGLIHSHAWTVAATVAGDPDCDKVFPADDLERILHDTIEPWTGHYLTRQDVGPWRGFGPIVWDREPTVEEIVRRIWTDIDPKLPDLVEVSLEESNEFDRCRTVRLRRS